MSFSQSGALQSVKFIVQQVSLFSLGPASSSSSSSVCVCVCMFARLLYLVLKLIIYDHIGWHLHAHFIAEFHQLLGADGAVRPEIGTACGSAQIVASVTHELAHVGSKIPFTWRHIHHPGHSRRSARNDNEMRKTHLACQSIYHMCYVRQEHDSQGLSYLFQLCLGSTLESCSVELNILHNDSVQSNRLQFTFGTSARLQRDSVASSL